RETRLRTWSKPGSFLSAFRHFVPESRWKMYNLVEKRQTRYCQQERNIRIVNHRSNRRHLPRRIADLARPLVVCAGLIGLSPAYAQTKPDATPKQEANDITKPFTETIPGTVVKFEMLPIPAGPITLKNIGPEKKT